MITAASQNPTVDSGANRPVLLAIGEHAEIERLLRMLRLMNGRVAEPPLGENGASFERWGDDNYVYLEVELPESEGMEIDISIMDGRACVRMSR